MKAKKGFTFAELLVALACSAIVLLGIVTTFGVVMNLQDHAIDTAESTHYLPVLREYICQNNITSNEFVIRNGTISHKGNVIAIETSITSITFTETQIGEVSLTLCRIREGNRNYEFPVTNTP